MNPWGASRIFIESLTWQCFCIVHMRVLKNFYGKGLFSGSSRPERNIDDVIYSQRPSWTSIWMWSSSSIAVCVRKTLVFSSQTRLQTVQLSFSEAKGLNRDPSPKLTIWCFGSVFWSVQRGAKEGVQGGFPRPTDDLVAIIAALRGGIAHRC